MSSSSPVQNGQPSGGMWPTLVPYFAPPAAASAAIIPVFYGFVAKSAQQVGDSIPKMSATNALKAGFKAAPTIGAIVGTQMVVQSIVEKALMPKTEKDAKPSFSSSSFSSMMLARPSLDWFLLLP